MLSHQSIAWLCLIHLSLFIIVLLMKREAPGANRMLALFMFGLAYGHANHLMVFTHVAWRFFFLNELVFVFPFLMGPAFLQYTGYMTGTRIDWKRNGWVHLLPAIFILPYYLSFFFDSPQELKTFYDESLIRQPVSNSLLLGLLTLQLVLYMLRSLQLLKRYHRRLSSRERPALHLGWLRMFIIGWLIVCLIVAPVLILLSDSDATVLFVITPSITTALYLFLFVKAISFRGRVYEQRVIRELERKKFGAELYEEFEAGISQIIKISEKIKSGSRNGSAKLEEIDRHTRKLVIDLQSITRKPDKEA